MNRVRGMVDATALQPVKVKGKEQELRIYNLTGIKGEDWRPSERTNPNLKR